jgi:hypothetical protein
MNRGHSLFGIIYIVVGVAIAASHGYLANLFTLSGILSAILAILLWPLVVLGINLVIAI